MCNMIHPCMMNASFVCVTYLIHMCDMTPSCVRHDSFICVTWHTTATYCNTPQHTTTHLNDNTPFQHEGKSKRLRITCGTNSKKGWEVKQNSTKQIKTFWIAYGANKRVWEPPKKRKYERNRTSHVTHIKTSIHAWHKWVMSHVWMDWVSRLNESCHTYEWVMSYMSMSHVTHMNEPFHTYKWVMSHV